MTDLPEGLQEAYDVLTGVLSSTMMATRDYEAATAAVEALVAPYRTAQKAYAAGSGLYSPHPAFHIRSEGERRWTTWPSDRPMPSVMDLLMLVHEKNDPAESPEDA